MPNDTKYSPSSERTPGASQSRSQSQQQLFAGFWQNERAQTSIDLMLAIMIFFGAVALLTVTSPNLFFPQGLSATDDTTDADRIGIELTTANLTQPDVSGLAHENVTGFLGATNNLHDQFGVEDGKRVNVTIETSDRANPPLALDPAEPHPDYTVQDTGDEFYVTRGPAPDGLESKYTHHTSLNGKPITITVIVWRT